MPTGIPPRLSSFIPTPDVVDGLRVILGKIKQATGCGIFIKGNFGSGKSHLLSYIYILLTQPQSVHLSEELAQVKPEQALSKVIKLSLVKYPSILSLNPSCLNSLVTNELCSIERLYSKNSSPDPPPSSLMSYLIPSIQAFPCILLRGHSLLQFLENSLFIIPLGHRLSRSGLRKPGMFLQHYSTGSKIAIPFGCPCRRHT